MKTLGLMLLLAGMAGALCALPTGAPEIDPGSAGTAITLLGGAILLIKGRRK